MKYKITIVLLSLWTFCFLAGRLFPSLSERVAGRSRVLGDAKIQHLVDLYHANMFEDVLKGCDQLKSDGSVSITPEALYVKWWAERSLERGDAANHTAEQLLTMYPQNALDAQVHFQKAMDFLRSDDKLAARLELLSVAQDFPDSKESIPARKLLADIWGSGK